MPAPMTGRSVRNMDDTEKVYTRNNETPRELNLLTPAREYWYFQLSHDVARHNAQFARRAMQERWVCVITARTSPK